MPILSACMTNVVCRLVFCGNKAARKSSALPSLSQGISWYLRFLYSKASRMQIKHGQRNSAASVSQYHVED